MVDDGDGDDDDDDDDDGWLMMMIAPSSLFLLGNSCKVHSQLNEFNADSSRC